MSFVPNTPQWQQAAEAAMQMVVDFYQDLEQRRVFPAAPMDQIADQFRGSLDADTGIGLTAALDEFAHKVILNSNLIAHPKYLGLVNCAPLPGAILADLLVSALNANAGTQSQ